eukprot:CAMPEP_0115005884 /NCGR_PEP_ID=MMETSP0216-20121206/20153_1 /TAXON_ID=223996 /ORGANISM="Protocruzia adherens, Strain Boccale" /LENGTH=191 /DNA_ID=CAMNT_0002372327 /DNA_START=143 /DNA_END=718 /DNA_ORIENTATION=+
MSSMSTKIPVRATTILSVRKDDEVVLIGDGQVSYGPTIFKDNAKKVRKLENSEDVVIGFAGSAADAFTLMELLEAECEKYPRQILRACINVAKLWRGREYKHLEASMLVVDSENTIHLDGSGNVFDMTIPCTGIGSGGLYAQSAAQALVDIDGLTAEEIARKSMKIAADTCIYTNHNFVVEKLPNRASQRS